MFHVFARLGADYKISVAIITARAQSSIHFTCAMHVRIHVHVVTPRVTVGSAPSQRARIISCCYVFVYYNTHHKATSPYMVYITPGSVIIKQEIIYNM